MPETTDQDVDADTAAAEAALITLDDLPEGWTEAALVGDASTLDDRDARTVVAFTAEPGVPDCLATAYGDLVVDELSGSLAEGASFGAPTAARLQVGSTV